MSYTPKQRTFKKRESKEEFAARKKAEKEQAYEIIDNSITDMMQNDEHFKEYLHFQSRMERYTVSNTLLIMAQCPDATRSNPQIRGESLTHQSTKAKKELKFLSLTIMLMKTVSKEHHTMSNMYLMFHRPMLSHSLQSLLTIHQRHLLRLCLMQHR